MRFKLWASCALGLEAVVARELQKLEVAEIQTDNGWISFEGSNLDLARANLWLRTADRVWWEVASFPCRTFEELFQGVKGIPWGEILPVDAEFPMQAHTYKSQLTSLPAIQRTAKKAVVEVLQSHYRRLRLSEEGDHYPLKVFLVADRCRVLLDTSGSGLHRRGYRTWNAPAPLRETLAAALVQLSVWNKERPLVDPFCGSGTICLEAAMLGLNMAPGLTRRFAAEKWPIVGRSAWEEALEEAESAFDERTQLDICGYDNDPQTLKLARLHLKQCGLEGRGISFREGDVRRLRLKGKYGVVITNPPYGQRLLEIREAEELYSVLGEAAAHNPTWSYYVISSHPKFEEFFGARAQRRRKVHNSMLACQYFQFPGPKPPKGEEG